MNHNPFRMDRNRATPETDKALSFDEFYSRFAGEIWDDTPCDCDGTFLPELPRASFAHQLSHVVELRAAKLAAEHNSPEAFSFWVRRFLSQYVGIIAPEGVFRKFREAPRGRKRSEQRLGIWLTWRTLGKPSLYKGDLAAAVYGSAYTDAPAPERRRLRDKLRHSVERQEEEQEPK